ncbi:hypothetical protein PR048_031677 [Dryococelus australis]|uniref:Uncharacterized protein n=1 Tax=Dryococelus australis TaxID=614101 RepID=A0ABQ9G6Y8_9NEOP|nr:hypothetical protein PR048_031677 [Dryococelus australis]
MLQQIVNNEHKMIRIPVILNSRHCLTLVDTAASHNFAREIFIMRTDLRPTETEIQLAMHQQHGQTICKEPRSLDVITTMALLCNNLREDEIFISPGSPSNAQSWSQWHEESILDRRRDGRYMSSTHAQTTPLRKYNSTNWTMRYPKGIGRQSRKFSMKIGMYLQQQTHFNKLP